VAYSWVIAPNSIVAPNDENKSECVTNKAKAFDAVRRWGDACPERLQELASNRPVLLRSEWRGGETTR